VRLPEQHGAFVALLVGDWQERHFTIKETEKASANRPGSDWLTPKIK